MPMAVKWSRSIGMFWPPNGLFVGRVSATYIIESLSKWVEYRVGSSKFDPTIKLMEGRS